MPMTKPVPRLGIKEVKRLGILIFYNTSLNRSKRAQSREFEKDLAITFNCGNDAPQEETNDRFYRDFNKDCKLR
jgi:hypothetical protein